MKITPKSQALHKEKPEGISVDYYLFSEYEIHHNTQAPHTTQIWHHHEKVWETIFVLSGELTIQWKENDQKLQQILSPGDVIETEHTAHTFVNNSEQPAEFLVFKQVLSGEDKTDILKYDKVVN